MGTSIKSIFLSSSLIAILLPIVTLAQLDKGLVAKYTFNNGETIDEVGKNNAKVYGASLTEDRFGNEKSAYFLHGNKNSFINLGTSDVLKPVKGSISIWIKIEHAMESGKGVESNPILITRAHSGVRHNEAYYIGYDYKSKNINVNTTYSQLDQISIYSVSNKSTLGIWHHVVMTYDDKFLKYYLDGHLEAKMPKNFTSRFLKGDSVIVGNVNSSENVRFFNGCVDDIEFYNRVISEEEVQRLYHTPYKLSKQTIIKWAVYALSLVLISILLVIWIVKQVYRRKLEKQKAENALNARLNELETKAIRTQMNPHFIFNSLNTLQRFILEKDTTSAHSYLRKFSKLLRKLLESSTLSSIPLNEEIDILKNYIEIEKMRFGSSFEYEIINEIKEPEKIKIPFMLIQPFVENAVWHGLMPKSGIRLLKIKFSELDEKRILCTVDDNGVGRNYKDIMKDPLKKKSLAMEFIRQRLELIEKSTGIPCSFMVIDKTDSEKNSLGTTIEIIIPTQN